MPLSIWEFKLYLGDVFRNDELNFDQVREEIVHRIKISRFWKCSDVEAWNLEEITMTLQSTRDIHEFNRAWNSFLDWADDNRVWVEA